MYLSNYSSRLCPKDVKFRKFIGQWTRYTATDQQFDCVDISIETQLNHE